MLDSPYRAPEQDFHLPSQRPCQAHLRPPSGRPPLRAHRVSSPAPTHRQTRSTTRSLTELPYHPHIQHESIKTTHIYQQADPALKEQAIARVASLGTKPGRYRPSDALLAFLDASDYVVPPPARIPLSRENAAREAPSPHNQTDNMNGVKWCKRPASTGDWRR
jgi:hypothetical protein